MRIVARENKINHFYRLNQLSLKSNSPDEIFEREQLTTPNSVGMLLYNCSAMVKTKH